MDELAQAGGDVICGLGSQVADMDVDDEAGGSAIDHIAVEAAGHETALGEEFKHARHHASFRGGEDGKAPDGIGSEISRRHETQAPETAAKNGRKRPDPRWGPGR